MSWVCFAVRMGLMGEMWREVCDGVDGFMSYGR